MTSSCEGTVTGATFAFIQLLNVGVPSASPFSLSHLNHCLARDRLTGAPIPFTVEYTHNSLKDHTIPGAAAHGGPLALT